MASEQLQKTAADPASDSASGLISSHNTLISGGSFNQVVTVNYGHFETFGESSTFQPLAKIQFLALIVACVGLHLLSQAISLGAMHDSSERYPPARCEFNKHARTVKQIVEWAQHRILSDNILWVAGPPNTGKTAVAQTIAETLSESGHLAGSFFFSRDKPRRNDAHYLFLTLAYQIATNVPGMREHINAAVYHDPTLLTKSAGVQIQSLIVKPFQILMTSDSKYPTISTVVIDGLDECATPWGQRDVLRFILAEGSRRPPIPLRFLIFSRPEDQIQSMIDELDVSSLIRQIILDDQEELTDATSPPSLDLPSISRRPRLHDDPPKALMIKDISRASKYKNSSYASAVIVRRAIGASSPPRIGSSTSGSMDLSPSTSPRSTMDVSPYASPSSAMNISPNSMSPASMMSISPPSVDLHTSSCSVSDTVERRSISPLALESIFPSLGSVVSAANGLRESGRENESLLSFWNDFGGIVE